MITGEAVPVVINAGAGNPHVDKRVKELAELFAARDLPVDVRLAKSGDELDALMREAAAARPRLLIAAGGDGTISTAAAALVDSPTVLGVLPFGTLNHFAKDLRIPLELEEAVGTILDGYSVAVDVGDVNGRVFINNSSLGLYPDMVRDRERQQTRLGRGKWRSLVWASIAAFRRYPFMTVRIDLEGQRRVHVTPIVFVGNNEYVMEGFDIGARERIDDGKFSIYIVKKQGRAALVRLALQALIGRLRQARDFEALEAAEFVIETRHSRILVATDGEVQAMSTPLHFRLRPKSLRVIVPRVPV
ncbi:MAG: diacylglycerol kinase family lipid kinase [Gemmatimonadota bacterium]|nr:diacylglycerol kinase family lipid kinase [Gemmatimonadota bacterium]